MESLAGATQGPGVVVFLWRAPSVIPWLSAASLTSIRYSGRGDGMDGCVNARMDHGRFVKQASGLPECQGSRPGGRPHEKSTAQYEVYTIVLLLGCQPERYALHKGVYREQGAA